MRSLLLPVLSHSPPSAAACSQPVQTCAGPFACTPLRCATFCFWGFYLSGTFRRYEIPVEPEAWGSRETTESTDRVRFVTTRTTSHARQIHP
ncbi:hypothetical protein BGX38DRAFT_1172785 [Terfezia claveryi]|nr:hypothetical protein BGX38DRAFT_1172785 [Terfezia claveryi]